RTRGAGALPRAPRARQHRGAGDPRPGGRGAGRAASGDPRRAGARPARRGGRGRGVMGTGAWRERFAGAWGELRENLPRAVLRTRGVILGVASVVGGFSISDSQRRQSEHLFVRLGGLDKLNVLPSAVLDDGSPSALQMANLGLRAEDSERGRELD